MSRKKNPPTRSVSQVVVSPPKPGVSAVYIAIALAVITVAVFAGVATHDFVLLDDNLYIADNAVVQKGLTLAGIRYAFATYAEFYWHPLTWLSHMADCQFFGLKAGGHHVTNLILHVASVVLLFLLLRRMTGAVWRSAAAAALFAIHPLRVESVAWIAERKDLLVCLFWLLTMWLWVDYAKSGSKKRYAAALLMFVLALMSKPSAVTLPFALLLLDYWPLERRLRVVEKLPFFALALASSVLTYIGQRQWGAMERMSHVPLSDRLANALVAYAAYLRDMVWPQALAVPYPYHLPLPALTLIAAAALLLAITGLVVWQWKRRYLAMGWFWFVGVLVPMIGIVQVGAQSRADRFTLIPSIGLFVLVAWGVAELAERGRISHLALGAVSVAAILALGVRAWAQVPVWQNTETLLGHSIAVTGGTALAHLNLGYEHLMHGRPAVAESEFRAAMAMDAENVKVRANLGYALYEQGRYGESLMAFMQALRMRPDYAIALSGRGMAYQRLGHHDIAMESFRKALAHGLSDKQAADAHNSLAAALLYRNRYAEAAVELRQAVKLNPDFHTARMNLARVLAAMGQNREAAEQIQTVLAAAPDFPGAREELNEVGQAVSPAQSPGQAKPPAPPSR